MSIGIGIGISPIFGRPLGGGAAASYLLDIYSATAAYSTRKLKSTATNALRLRRDSDSVESDFGFDAGGNLDTAAITTWLGGANGRLVIWYDQSGNGNDATQATAGSQPTYATDGAGEPYFVMSDTLTVANTVTASNVSRYDSLPGIGGWSLSGRTLSGAYTLQRSTNQVILVAAPDAATNTALIADAQTQAQRVASGQITSLSSFFFNAALSSINVELVWNTAAVTNMSFMFRACTAFNQSVANFNTALVTNMQAMFQGCTAFNQSVANFNTALVTNMQAMFYTCTAFNQSVANFNTALVTNMRTMFYGCTAFNQSVANFNTALVTDMSYMFLGCTAFNQSVANFNTALVTNMQAMFYTCTAFNQSVANFNTALVTDMSYMFLGCTAFNQSVANFNTALVTNMGSMFQGCTAFNQDLSGFDVTALTNAINMLLNATLSTANYDALLIGWEAQAVQNSVTFHGGNSKYTGGGAAETARTALINDHLWSITDGGIA